jgi:hypothetical protein
MGFAVWVEGPGALFPLIFPLDWRRGWDSNPRESCPSGGFQDRCLKPLGHLSRRAISAGEPYSRHGQLGNPTRLGPKLDHHRAAIVRADNPPITAAALVSTGNGLETWVRISLPMPPISQLVFAGLAIVILWTLVRGFRSGMVYDEGWTFTASDQPIMFALSIVVRAGLVVFLMWLAAGNDKESFVRAIGLGWLL